MFFRAIFATLVLLGSFGIIKQGWPLYGRFRNRCKFDSDSWDGLKSVKNAPYENSPIQLDTMYVESHDGTKLAVNLFRPTRAVHENHKLDVVVIGTRYNRSMRIRFPFSLFVWNRDFSLISDAYTKEFVKHGYGVVIFDVRGTGASFGKRNHDLEDDELLDMKSIIEWATSRTWSTDNVAVHGISYSGLLAESTLKFKLPQVKAISISFSPFDSYRSVFYPNCVKNVGFFQTYIPLVQSLEWHQNRPDYALPPHSIIKFLARIAAEGPSPVQNDYEALDKAREEHLENSYPTDLQGFTTADDYLEDLKDSLHNWTYRYYSSFKGSTTPLLIYNSWHDIFVESGFHRYQFYNHSNVYHRIGGWNHGGLFRTSPQKSSASVCHRFEVDIVNFFNSFIKPNHPSFGDSEKRIRYFTMRKEEFQSDTDVFPPNNVQTIHLSLDNGKLSLNEGNHSFSWNETIPKTTGVISRWAIVQQIAHQMIEYHEPEADISFLSDPLKNDTTTTGFNTLHLYGVNTNDCNATIFAYLIEVFEDGRTNYITDGHARLSSARLFKHYLTGLEERSCLRSDISEILPLPYLKIKFLPTSYQLKKNSRLKLIFTASDVDNFESVSQTNLWFKIEKGILDMYIENDLLAFGK